MGRLQRLVRTPRRGGGWQLSSEVTSLLTSRPAARANAAARLRRKRAHWLLESWHWTRDVTFGEDASQIHAGQAPQGFALLRNAAISLLRWPGAPSPTALQRDLATRPTASLTLFATLAHRLVEMTVATTRARVDERRPAG